MDLYISKLTTKNLSMLIMLLKLDAFNLHLLFTFFFYVEQTSESVCPHNWMNEIEKIKQNEAGGGRVLFIKQPFL